MIAICTFLVLYSVACAALSRWHGGGFGDGPRWARQAAWAWLIMCLGADALVKADLPFSWYLLTIFLTFWACFGGKAMATGAALDYGCKDGAFWGDAGRMALINAAAVSGAAFCFGFTDLWASAITVTVAALGGPVGWIGWAISGDDNQIDNARWHGLKEGTQVNEALRGFLAGVGVYIGWLMVVS